MARPKTAKRIKNLLKVEGGANNNKYYDMYDTGDGSFVVYFGRVGATEQVKIYPISEWDKKYKEKIGSRKGYKDITHLKIENHVQHQFADISDSIVAKLISDLQRYAKNLIDKTYLVGAGSVTMAQIQEAQKIIDELLLYTNGNNGGRSLTLDESIYVSEVNKILQNLYTIIPRKMKNVRDYLINSKNPDVVKRMVANEQDNLDTMEGQVKNIQLQQDNTDDKQTLLEAMGLTISPVDQNTINYIKSKMSSNAPQFRSAFRVVNVKTQKIFDSALELCDNKKREDFWHGSRNQNWWSILGTGLVLRPTNVVITGKMFGYGIYFADKFQKSLGYTSLSGSYWAGGNDNRAYLALFDVHVGKQYVVDRHRSELNQFNWEKLRKYGNYDSLFAKAGISLRNSEFIVYKQDQTTIKYIVEVGV